VAVEVDPGHAGMLPEPGGPVHGKGPRIRLGI
jgi:hypothetical protein